MYAPPRNAALLMIDVQRGFDDPKLGRRNNPEAEENCARLLEGWRRALLPIFHAQHLSDEPESPLRAGQPGAEYKDPVRPLGDEDMAEQRVNSAFIGTHRWPYDGNTTPTFSRASAIGWAQSK